MSTMLLLDHRFECCSKDCLSGRTNKTVWAKRWLVMHVGSKPNFPLSTLPSSIRFRPKPSCNYQSTSSTVTLVHDLNLPYAKDSLR